MWKSREIAALLQLIDDPDEEVFDTVSAKILHYGKEIIPNLESLWERTVDVEVQHRIEHLIHRVQFQNLQNDLLDWSNGRRQDLFRGALIVARYQFPELNVPSVLNQYEQIRRNVWLELNTYLTPLEQVNVINSILYNYYKFQGHELSEREPKHFCINQLLESRQGNGYTIGLLYLALCELLDVPVFAVDIPRQFVFAYIETVHQFYDTSEAGIQQTHFFIDPANGMVYTIKDVDAYLNKINAPNREHPLLPLTPRQVLCKMLDELALCYRYKREDEKALEILQLKDLITTNAKIA